MEKEQRQNGGRRKKTGLNYFPLFGELFTGEKMRECERCLDNTGENLTKRLILRGIVVQVYSIILASNYYLDWNKDTEKQICNSIGNGINPESLKPYLDAMMCSNFLNRRLFDEYKVLTSRGLQQKWMMIINMTRHQRQGIDPKFFIESEKNRYLVDGKIKSKPVINKTKPISSPINSNLTPDGNGIHKLEPVWEATTGPAYTPPPKTDKQIQFTDIDFQILEGASEELKETWLLWVNYLFNEKNKEIKSLAAKKAAFESCMKLAGYDQDKAIKIIKQSMGKTWANLRELEVEKPNGFYQNGNGGAKSPPQSRIMTPEEKLEADKIKYAVPNYS